MITIKNLFFLLVGISLPSLRFLLFYSPTCETCSSNFFNNVSAVDTSWITNHEKSQNTNQNVSDLLYNRVRVFCFIINTKNSSENQALHVHATWAKRCNKHVFVTALEGYGLPTLDFHLKESRRALFPKIEKTLKHIYKHELKNFDFFLKADFDTYFVMDNLRFLLLPYSPDNALHFGCRFTVGANSVYMSGGAGYVFSREAVRTTVEKGFDKLKACKASKRHGEDIEIGKCMSALNVTAVDTRDKYGRHRFLPFSPLIHMRSGTTPLDHSNYFYYNYTQGEDCCSDYIVSFHYVHKDMMYVIDGFLNRFRTIGINKMLWSRNDDPHSDVIAKLEKLSLNV